MYKEAEWGGLLRVSLRVERFVIEGLYKHIKGASAIQQGLFLQGNACFFQVSARVDEMKET